MVKTFKRGDIVLVPIVFSDLSGVKLRPALIIEADSFVSSFADCLVATITSNTSRISSASILLTSDSGGKTGLAQDSVILLDRITNVPRFSIKRSLGHLEDLTQVDRILKLIFGLS